MVIDINPETDLVLTRDVDVAPEALFRGWTQPELIAQWFTPAPWTTARAKLDVRPGGESLIVMEDPAGNQYPNPGIYLEVVENRKLVFTDMMGKDFAPKPDGFFVGIILFEPKGEGTKYTAIARHKTAEARKQHEEMGFHQGWGAALDQLVALMKG